MEHRTHEGKGKARPSAASAGATNDWNAALYDRKLSFVSGYGAELLELLQARPGETVLDVGCGTGDLARRIADAGASVVGLDASPAMIEEAQRKYPDLEFRVGAAEAFELDRPADAVFSNAALHWVADATGAARCMYAAAKPGGRLVAEFGGADNVASIIAAVVGVLTDEFGIADAAARDPWYFPTVGQYASLLEAAGWRVAYAAHYDRPTKLDGMDGMAAWLNVFAAPFFAGLGADERARAVATIADRLRPVCFDAAANAWTADYKRIRVVATKPERR